MRVTFKWDGNYIVADIFALIYNSVRGQLFIDQGDGTGFVCTDIPDSTAEKAVQDLRRYGYTDLSEFEFVWTDKMPF